MRASRLVSIMLLLQGRRRMTARELADTLGISVRTIYRDMEALNAAGVPITGEAGNEGGYRLIDGYRTQLTGLTADEAQSLFLAGVPTATSALGLDAAAVITQVKLLAAVTPTARERAEDARQRVHIDTAPWGATSEPDPLLQELHQAIWDQVLTEIAYGISRRKHMLEPLGLVCKGVTWYLIARREGSLRTYRTSRVHHLVTTGEHFQRPEGFDLARYWQDNCRHYVRTFARTTVRLRLRGNALLRVVWVQAQAKTIAEPDADGWAEAELILEDEDNALRVIRVLGDETIVVEPDALRQKAVELARTFTEANTYPAEPDHDIRPAHAD